MMPIASHMSALSVYTLYNKRTFALQAPGGRASAESIKNKKRVIKMVLIVVVIFALSWLPIHVILVLRALHMYATTPANMTIQIISHILAYSNSCINPILYAFLSEPFRRGFWAVMTCMRPSGPHGVQNNGFEMEMADARARKKKKAAEAVVANKTPNAAAATTTASVTPQKQANQTSHEGVTVTITRPNNQIEADETVPLTENNT